MGASPITKTLILKRLSEIIEDTAKIEVDGRPVGVEHVKEALIAGAAALKTRRFPVLRWILFSVVLSLFVAVVFKTLGMAMSGELKRLDLSSELLLRGDILLISTGFALEAVGDLFAAEIPGETRMLVGFPCVIGLIASMCLIALASFIPLDVHFTVDGTLQYATHSITTPDITSYSQASKFMRLGCLPVFLTTMGGVLVTKFLLRRL